MSRLLGAATLQSHATLMRYRQSENNRQTVHSRNIGGPFSDLLTLFFSLYIVSRAFVMFH